MQVAEGKATVDDIPKMPAEKQVKPKVRTRRASARRKAVAAD
jgi:hypothetical protein